MGTSKLEVMWSPLHTNRFITWSNDIYLYEVRSQKDHVKPSDVIISDNTVARLLATNSNYRYIKCIDIYPRYENDLLLAVGQANGKVCLTTFGPSMYDAMGLAGLELGPRYPRQCNALMWNVTEPNLLATAFEKHRSDHSIQVWDVMKSPLQSNLYNSTSGGSQNLEYIKPVIEIGLADTANSIAWLNRSPHTLIAGINNRHLKIVDIRDVSKSTLSVATKSVMGISISPYNEIHIASYGENVISLWDLRRVEKPLLVITQNKIVTKVSWCPTRRNLIGSLLKESPAIHLYDMQQTMEGNEPSSLNRSIQPGNNVPLTSFSWHPKNENRLIAISYNGALTDYLVFERMTLNWSPSSHIVWTYGRRHLKTISDRDKMYKNISDISPRIKRRAKSEYGLKSELWQNGEISENESLQIVWQWLYLSKCLVEDGVITTDESIKHPGIRCVLGLDSHTIELKESSEMVDTQWADVPATIVTYKSKAREDALQLCGWKFQKDNSLLDKLELDGAYSRAATIAIFHLQLRSAIDILNRGATRHQPNLAVIAMALSGYSPEKKSLWKELCLSSREQLNDHYLKAAFSFLAQDMDTYDEILNDPNLAIDDKIAFACIYLSDGQLMEYITRLTDIVYEEGDITGILLTGSCEGCIPLLQSYLDTTGDVQSVSLIAVRALSYNLIYEHPNCQSWINSYQSLLDCWRLWNERARYDIYLNAEKTTEPQVFINCSFCGKSITAFMQGESDLRKSPQSSLSNKIKGAQTDGVSPGSSQSQPRDDIVSCPSCHKPLPRCAICLGNMGTLSTYSGHYNKPPNAALKLSEFSSWFTWCQTCRHGGHSGHMLQWFEDNLECPVTGCTCHCLALDNH